MPTKESDSGQNALKQPWHDVEGLSVAYGDEIECRAELPLDPTDQSPLANAIRTAYPTSSPRYWASIARRFRELFEGVTEEEAVTAVLKGYSSPVDAIRSRVIRKQKYRGFGPHALAFKRWVEKLAMVTDDPAGDFIGDSRTLIRLGRWPKKPVASLEALLIYVRLNRGDETVLDAAKGAWRRYQLWAGVQP